MSTIAFVFLASFLGSVMHFLFNFLLNITYSTYIFYIISNFDFIVIRASKIQLALHSAY